MLPCWEEEDSATRDRMLDTFSAYRSPHARVIRDIKQSMDEGHGDEGSWLYTIAVAEKAMHSLGLILKLRRARWLLRDVAR